MDCKGGRKKSEGTQKLRKEEEEQRRSKMRKGDERREWVLPGHSDRLFGAVQTQRFFPR